MILMARKLFRKLMWFLYFFRYLADMDPTDQKIASYQNHKLERDENYDANENEDNKKS